MRYVWKTLHGPTNSVSRKYLFERIESLMLWVDQAPLIGLYLIKSLIIPVAIPA